MSFLIPTIIGVAFQAIGQDQARREQARQLDDQSAESRRTAEFEARELEDQIPEIREKAGKDITLLNRNLISTLSTVEAVRGAQGVRAGGSSKRVKDEATRLAREDMAEIELASERDVSVNERRAGELRRSGYLTSSNAARAADVTRRTGRFESFATVLGGGAKAFSQHKQTGGKFNFFSGGGGGSTQAIDFSANNQFADSFA